MSGFSEKLISWYNKNKRDLPWRKTSDPYKIWVSEIMLQQTTVNTVIDYYERWIRQYPTINHVAKASIVEILKSWQGLGYYQRARNLHKASQILIKDFNGQIPQELEKVRTLPGFGPYTTGSVLSIAYDKRVPIIDANVRRVIMRILALKGLADNKQDTAIYKFLEEVMPQKDLRSFNQGLMELGALVCKNSQPACLVCPLKNNCLAFKKGIQETIPETKKKNIKELNVSIGVIYKNKKFFIQQRASDGLLADLWEFPGGKIEKNEKPIEALKRELKEELGVKIAKAKHLFNVKHFYTQFKVNLHVFDCDVIENPKLNKRRCWIGFDEFKKYPMPSGTLKIVDKLMKIKYPY